MPLHVSRFAISIRPMTAKPAKSLPSPSTPQNLQGWSADASDPKALQAAIELAFNYRGDVTIVRKSNAQPIEGYIFDWRKAPMPAEPTLRLIPKDSDACIAIPVSD